MREKKLLIVDDDSRVREATRHAFEKDFEILEAAGVKEALQSCDLRHPDVIFLEIELNGFPDGWEVLREIRKQGRRTLVAIVTRCETGRRHPLMNEADGFFEKPCDLATLTAFLREKGILPFVG